ncbi:MAG: hypothetical protein CMH59_01020 [Myxococcales bacterium]|nr:hypothetical protein [Myxococcales bacterium]
MGHAQDGSTSVIVLGIRSVEGDDTLAQNLTGALRNEASGVAGWQVAEAEVSLAQMSMLHGCDEPDAVCMAAISQDLGQQRVIYGTVRRTGAGEEYDFALTLYFFNAESGQIEDSLTDTIPRAQTDIDDLRPRAERYIVQITGQARFGSIRLTVNTPGAEVELDGEPAGTTDTAGVLVIEDVAEGQHEIGISAVDHESFQGTVRVVADEQSDLRANLILEEGPSLAWVPGAAVTAAGVAFLAVGLRSWGNIRDYNDQRDSLTEEDVQTLRLAVEDNRRDPNYSVWQHMLVALNSDRNVCDDGLGSIDPTHTLRQEAESVCDDQDKQKRLAIIMNTLGVASIATGATLLLLALTGGSDDGGVEEAADARRFQLVPSFGRQQAGLTAFLEF